MNEPNSKHDPYDTLELHYLAIGDNFEKIDAEIKAGVNINKADKRFHNTPLHWTTYAKHVEMCILLIKNGGDLNLQNYKGNTPIHHMFSKKVINKILTLNENINYLIFDNLKKSYINYMIQSEIGDLLFMEKWIRNTYKQYIALNAKNTKEFLDYLKIENKEYKERVSESNLMLAGSNNLQQGADYNTIIYNLILKICFEENFKINNHSSIKNMI